MIKSPDKTVFHVGTNNMCDAAPQEIINGMKDLKSFKQQYAPESKIVISTPVVRVDKVMQVILVKSISTYLRKPKWITFSMIISSITRV